MKTRYLFIVAILMLPYFPFSASAQTKWVYDKELAKGLAIEKDQLIMMDFWASWCGPCKKMDSEMWNNPDFNSLTSNVIPFKINIDENRNLAIKYGVSSIPRVILATASGDVIADITGYGRPLYHEELLSQVPQNLNGINELLMEVPEDYDEQKFLKVAEKAQEIAISAEGPFKSGFFRLSDDYYKSISKETEKEEMELLADMNMLLNDAYLGNHKKALRKIEKIDLAQNSDLNELKTFIKAYCFKCDGDQEAFNQAKKALTSQKYISQLD